MIKCLLLILQYEYTVKVDMMFKTLHYKSIVPFTLNFFAERSLERSSNLLP